MKVLLDTHTLIWWWTAPERLSTRALELLMGPDTEVYVSAASAWEVATKSRIGKLPAGDVMAREWSKRLALDRFRELPISARHAVRAGSLPGDHRDPFDRMLAAQGIEDGMPVLTADCQISGLGAEAWW